MTDLEREQRALVVAVARSFISTPYHHAGTLKGVGIDCATLLREVFVEAGLVEPFELPKYGQQWHLHRREEIYKSYVERFLVPIAAEAVGPGDVVMYRWGHLKAHGGIIAERGWPQIIHAYSRARMVIEADGRGGDLADKETEFFSYWGARA